MGKLVWDQVGTRKYEVGVDHGVLYQESNGEFINGVPWNGLVDVTTDNGDTNAADLFSGDVKIDIAIGNDTVSGTISAYTYPDEFEVCTGSVAAGPGFYVQQQGRNRFGLSYRTLIGNDVKGQEYGYKIHLLYNLAVISESHAHSTVSDSTDDIELNWDFDALPMITDDDDYDPYSELVFDSTKFSPEFMESLETILYGTETEDPRMPDLDELLDLYTEDEPMPIEWTGFPNELLYPSTTLYPMEVVKKCLICTTEFVCDFDPVSIGPGETVFGDPILGVGDPIFPWHTYYRPPLMATITGLPDNLTSILRAWFILSDDQTSFTPKIVNDSDNETAVISEPITIRYLFETGYFAYLNGLVILAGKSVEVFIPSFDGRPLLPATAIINDVEYIVDYEPTSVYMEGIQVTSYRFNTDRTCLYLTLLNTTDSTITIPTESDSPRIGLVPIFTYVVPPEGGE